MTAGDYFSYTGTVKLQRSGYSESNLNVEWEETYSNGGGSRIVSSSSQKTVDQSNGDISQYVSSTYYENRGGVDYLILEQGNDENFYAVNELNGEPVAVYNVINGGSFSTYFTYSSCTSYSSNTCSNPSQVAAIQVSYTLIGTESVTTPAGIFESYKIKAMATQTSNDTDAFSNTSQSAMMWYYPALGTVKQTWTYQLSDYSPAIIGEATKILKSTNNNKYSRNRIGKGTNFIQPIMILSSPLRQTVEIDGKHLAQNIK